MQRLKREVAKNVNGIEVAIQRIRTKPEYQQAEERIQQRELLPQRILETPRRNTIPKTLTPKSRSRTQQMLLKVPPTPVQHRRRSLPQVPQTPSVINLLSTNANSTIRYLPHAPENTPTVDNMMLENKSELIDIIIDSDETAVKDNQVIQERSNKSYCRESKAVQKKWKIRHSRSVLK